MSRPRFLADHDLFEFIIRGVRRREPAVDFQRVRDHGLQASSDPHILEFAAVHGLVIVSHDANTMAGYAVDRIQAGLPMAGLIIAPQRLPIGKVVGDLLLIWGVMEDSEW